MRLKKARARSGEPPTDPDRSYLAYIRPTPRPFLRFTSGHFPPGTTTTPHRHGCLALHGCLQGPLVLLTPEGEQSLDEGVFYLIPPGVRHHWRNDGRHTAATLGLLIDAEHPGRWPAGSGVETGCQRLSQLVRRLERFTTTGDSDLRSSYWHAADHLTAETPREPMVTTGHLLNLIGRINERLGSSESTTSPRTDLAQRIRRHLLARVNDRLSINEISREMGVSPTRAKQTFRDAFGCGIIAYFNQLKVWQAKRLLSDLSLTVEQVSDRLGFANPAYFTRVFSQHAEETPTEFRHQFRSRHC
jgi:AraC-like DNA-binding protein/quercetin dioxygenase-like cupin family protein